MRVPMRFAWQYRLAGRLRQVRRGLAYAFGTINAPDAVRMIDDLEPVAGRYGLAKLDVADVLRLAETHSVPGESLHRAVENACSFVAGRWEDHGDVVSLAEEWALEKNA